MSELTDEQMEELQRDWDKIQKHFFDRQVEQIKKGGYLFFQFYKKNYNIRIDYIEEIKGSEAVVVMMDVNNRYDVRFRKRTRTISSIKKDIKKGAQFTNSIWHERELKSNINNVLLKFLKNLLREEK